MYSINFKGYFLCHRSFGHKDKDNRFHGHLLVSFNFIKKMFKYFFVQFFLLSLYCLANLIIVLQFRVSFVYHISLFIMYPKACCTFVERSLCFASLLHSPLFAFFSHTLNGTSSFCNRNQTHVGGDNIQLLLELIHFLWRMSLFTFPFFIESSDKNERNNSDLLFNRQTQGCGSTFYFLSFFSPR